MFPKAMNIQNFESIWIRNVSFVCSTWVQRPIPMSPCLPSLPCLKPLLLLTQLKTSHFLLLILPSLLSFCHLNHNLTWSPLSHTKSYGVHLSPPTLRLTPAVWSCQGSGAKGSSLLPSHTSTFHKNSSTLDASSFRSLIFISWRIKSGLIWDSPLPQLAMWPRVSSPTPHHRHDVSLNLNFM